jgi:E3 ubiquitin-protein ligase RNF13
VTGDGICGSLRAADPANACAPIRNSAGSGPGMAFVLIARGNCSFEGKVLEAQLAGYDAAVVYDEEEKASLYSSELPATSSLSPSSCYAALLFQYQVTSTLGSWCLYLQIA